MARTQEADTPLTIEDTKRLFPIGCAVRRKDGKKESQGRVVNIPSAHQVQYRVGHNSKPKVVDCKVLERLL